MIKHSLLAAAIAALLPAVAAGQTNTVRATRLSVGPGTPAVPVVGDVRLVGVGTTGGTSVVFLDTNGDVIARALARADLPAAIAYEDEANIFTLAQTISSGTAAILNLRDTGAGTDLQYTRWAQDNGCAFLQHVNDAYSSVIASPWQSCAMGSVVLAPFSGQILPSAPYAGSIGSAISKWGQLWAGELNVETLISSEKVATTGGRFLVGTSTELIETISDAATTIKTKHNNLANGDRIYLESEGRVEWMAVTSGATRINTAGGGNLSVETGASDWATNGTVTLAQTTQVRYRGAASLSWTWTSGTADVYYNTGSMLAPSTQYTVSIYVRRVDGAAIVPTGSQYRMYIDAFNGVVVTPQAQDVGGGWYRLYGTGTTGASSQCCVGILNLPTGVQHFFDAVQVEAGATLTDWSASSASYTVTRNLDSTNANVWEAGSAIFDTGTTGNGWWDMYAIRGMKASSEAGPTIVANVRTGTTFNSFAPRFAAGNLNGLYGYGATTFGVAMGDDAATNVTIDATNGMRIRTGGTTVKFQADTAGNVSLTGDLIGTDWRIRNADGINLLTGTSTQTARQVWWSSTLGGTQLGVLYDTGTEFWMYRPSGNIQIQNNAGGIRLQGGGVSTPRAVLDLIYDSVNSAAYVELNGVSTGYPLAFRPGQAGSYDLGKTALGWRHVWMGESSTAPASPASGTELSLRMCGDKFVITFNDGGTVRYKSFDLTGTNITWAQATAAPAGC